METIREYLLAHAERDTPALLADERSWTWRQYVTEAARRAHAVRALLAPQRTAHVGLLMENTAEMALAISAGALGGYVPVGINLTRRGSALAQDIRRADCQVVLTDTTQRALLAGLDLSGVTVLDTDSAEWADRVAAHPSTLHDLPAAGADDTFMLIFTSGTSGPPKAVRVPNAMVALSGSALVDRFALGPDDVCYQSMPLFHSNAVLAGYAVATCAGATLALARRFSATTFLADVRRHGATYLNYVGKPLAYVLRTPELPDDADNPLRVAFGNEASDRDIAEFSRRFDVTVWDGFGSTETAVIIVRDEGTPPGSIGKGWPGVEIYDRRTRTPCPPAQFDERGQVRNLDEAVGEIVNVQGAGFFAGYYNDEEATQQRLAGGIYWSGDLAYRDQDGNIFLAGRTSDWLRVDGENLAAGLIEQILLRHPDISQAAVYAVPDPLVGDQLVAALIPRSAQALDPSGLESFLAAQEDLSPKAWPRYVRIASSLPSTATNKVLKRELTSQGLTFDDPCWERAERGRTYTPRTTNGAP